MDNVNYIRMRGVLGLKDCLNSIQFDTTTLSSEQYLGGDKVLLNSIEECKTANEIWNKLKEPHKKLDIITLKEFLNLRKSSNEDIREYINRRNNLYKKVRCAGFNFDSKVLMGLTLIGLPKEYDYLLGTINIDNDSLTPVSLEMRLTEEEKHLKNNCTTHSNRARVHSNNSPIIKIKEVELKTEDLHHSIEIKEEASIILESQPRRECKREETVLRKPRRNGKPLTCEICGYKCTHKGSLDR